MKTVAVDNLDYRTGIQNSCMQE